MKNKAKKYILTLMAAVMLCMAAFPLTAYAGGGEESTPPPPTETAVPEAKPNPITPDGAGTVVDNATDADGKVFYTIMTPNENVFYLIIDHQRSGENVYFLNAVTEADLMALAVPSDKDGSVSAIPGGAVPVEPEPSAPTPDPAPVAEPEEESGGPGMLILAVVVILGAGGAAYYFKIYRPKQPGADSGDEYEEYEAGAEPDADAWEDSAEPWDNGGDAGDTDDGPPWDEDEASEDDEATDGEDEEE